MNFTKMHGLGNDYVFVDCRNERVKEPAKLARVVSDRHGGIGSDGLILLVPSDSADVRMVMYNADGSRGEMCGNGIRCVAKYAVEHGIADGPELTVESDAGIKGAFCNVRQNRVESVRVDMGGPILDAVSIPTSITADRVVDHPLSIAGVTYRVTCVCLGNPHSIVFLDDRRQLATIDLATIGPQFENAAAFPNRINAHFVHVDSREHITMRTWERGSGMTRACGTGACAACVAGALTGRTDRRITAELPGGELTLEWQQTGHVFMTGPAVEVFSGNWPD